MPGSNLSNSTPASIRRVLVTGALGNIGRRIAPLLAREFDLTLTDYRTPADETKVIVADLMDYAQVERLMQGIDAVVHLAVVTGEGHGDTDVPGEIDPVDQRMLSVNTTSTFHVLEAARRNGVKRVIYASSLTILLGNKHRPAYDASTPLHPTNLYACTKLFGEQLAAVAWEKYGLSTICLRIGQPTPVDHPFDLNWQTNKRSRSWFVDVNDVAWGITCALRATTAFGVYNLVSASDNPRVDWRPAAKAIGYTPKAYFSDSGLSFHEDGDFPPHDGSVVTHNPGE